MDNQMKIFIKLFFVLTASSTFSFGQASDKFNKTIGGEGTLDVCSFYTPLISTDTYGLNVDFKFYPVKSLATGFCASIANRKIGTAFQYTIGQPIVYYYEFGWINQYDVLQKDRLRIGLNINNGISYSELGDNDVKVKYWTRYGAGEKAKIISTNYFYLLEPGLDINVRLFSHKHDPDFYLTLKTKYRFVFGDIKYGQRSDFTNFYFGLGISAIGFFDKK